MKARAQHLTAGYAPVTPETTATVAAAAPPKRVTHPSSEQELQRYGSLVVMVMVLGILIGWLAIAGFKLGFAPTVIGKTIRLNELQRTVSINPGQVADTGISVSLDDSYVVLTTTSCDRVLILG